MERAEHLQWCKDRANEYIDNGDANEAFASMVSDMSKHHETKDHRALEIMMMMKIGGRLNGADQMRTFINGFN